MFIRSMSVTLVAVAASLAAGCSSQAPGEEGATTEESLVDRGETDASACGLPIEKGPCRALFRRWAFDAERGACVQFVYGGCSGNANNFTSKLACDAACRPSLGGGLGGGEWKPNTGACAAVTCLDGLTCWSNGPLFRCR